MNHGEQDGEVYGGNPGGGGGQAGQGREQGTGSVQEEAGMATVLQQEWKRNPRRTENNWGVEATALSWLLQQGSLEAKSVSLKMGMKLKLNRE